MIKRDGLIEFGRDDVAVKQDGRGISLFFQGMDVQKLHTASVKPGACRGNHVHNQDEVLCILAGKGLCEIEVEDTGTGPGERIQIDESIKTYRIKAGVKHSVRNIGEREFYLVSFLTERKSDLPKTPKMQAKNHLADIMGINLEYALETYDWQHWHPMTDNGITVTGFWDKRKGVPDPEVYELDERGVYVRKELDKILL